MDKRKKRTSYQQYLLYIKLLEEDAIFRTGALTRDCDAKYLHRKWEELAQQLNTCGIGPILSAGEWKKRLTDWKNTTRAKYRKSVSEDKSVKPILTPLEQRALDLWGPISTKTQITTSHVDSSEINEADLKAEKVHVIELNLEEEINGSVEECENKELYTQEEQGAQNGEIADNVSYETEADLIQNLKSSPDIKKLTAELRRIADIQEERLKFEIAKFKFRNPGFTYEFPRQTSNTFNEEML